MYCVDCKLNRSFCQTCVPRSTASGGICSEPCTDTNCLLCPLNADTCAGCDSQTAVLVGGTCYLLSSIPTGFGMNLSTATSVPCASSGCTFCKSNYQICTECDQANGYILDNGQCKIATLEENSSDPTLNSAADQFSSIKIRRAKYRYNKMSAEVIFTVTCEQRYQTQFITVLDEVEQKSYQCQS